MVCSQLLVEGPRIASGYLRRIATNSAKRLSDPRSIRLIKIVLLVLIGSVALGYAAYRAVDISFTHDESFSFLHYIFRSTKGLFRLDDPYTNNHLLNSVGMKWSQRVFGPSEWALRLPNLILLAVYLFFCGALLMRKHVLLAVPAFILLASNTNLLGTFSVARGYGMSIGFMLMAVYFLIDSIRTGRRRTLIWLHFAFIGAVLSSFTQLDVYVTALALYYPLLLIKQPDGAARWRIVRRTAWVNALLLFVAYEILARPVQQVVRWNAFDFGGKTNFFDTTLRSTIYAITPGIGIPGDDLILWQICFLSVVALALINVACSALPRWRALLVEAPELAVCTGLLVGVSLVTIIQHHLLGTDYLEARFALFLVPLFLLVVIQLLFAFAKGWRLWLVVPVLFVLAGLSIESARRSAFPLTHGEWYYDVQTDDAITLITALHEGKEGRVRIGNSWEMEPTINFYRIKRGLDWMDRATRKGLSPKDDVRYLIEWNITPQDTAGYDVVQRFERPHTILLQRRMSDAAE